MTHVSIHQPNYFPWLGYFYKIAQSDVFIFLDDVAYPKSGNSMSSLCNRASVLSKEGGAYISCPVKRAPGVQIIHSVTIKNYDLHKQNLALIQEHYSAAPFFREIFPVLEGLFSQHHESLSDFNIGAIQKISALLGLKTVFHKQSDLAVRDKASTAMLLELVGAVHGTHYIAGQGGSKSYLDLEMATQQGIHVEFIRYPEALNGFQTAIGGKPTRLSVIDPLMHYGFEKTRGIIHENK